MVCPCMCLCGRWEIVGCVARKIDFCRERGNATEKPQHGGDSGVVYPSTGAHATFVSVDVQLR